MCMLITNITDSLDDLGYPDINELENGLKDLNIIYFSKLVSWIACRLNLFSSIDSCVNEIDNENDKQVFEIELSSLLKALNSPFDIESLKEPNTKLGILNFLCGEMIVAVFCYSKKNFDKPKEDEYDESEIAKILRLILFLMNEDLPKIKISINQLFDRIETNLKKFINEKKIQNEESFLNEFPKNKLTTQFWKKLEEFNHLFKEEYEIRRKTLITRSDCTVSSFKWRKENQNENLDKKIDELYKSFSSLLKQEINITLSDLIALKKNDYDELSNLSISKTHELCTIIPPNFNLANQAVQQKLSLHKFIIGNVPDRGGRTNEAIKPQQETFHQQYQQRNVRTNNQSMNINPGRIQGSGWNHNYDKYKQHTGHQNQQGDNHQSSSHDHNRMSDNDNSDGRYNRSNQNNYRGRGNFRNNNFYNRGKRGNNY